MRKIVLAAFLTVVAAGALYFGARWTFYGRFIRTTDNAYVKADTVVISAKIADRIAEVPVEENASVRKGDPLVLIDSGDWTAAVRKAEAEVAAREAALEAIRKQAILSDAHIADAAAAVQSAEATLTLQELDRKRYADLAKSDFASRQKLDQANADVKNWRGKFDSAKAALDAAKASAQVTLAQQQEAVAALQKAKAELDVARLNQENTIIRAPKDGVVGNLAARAGQYVTPGQQLMSLVPLSEVYVVANFKETQIRRIRPGAKVRLEFDAYPGVDIEGMVESFSPASGAEFSLLPPENATGNFVKIVQRIPVRIKILDVPEGVTILPGLSVTAAVDTRSGDEREALFSPWREEEGAPISSVAPDAQEAG